MLPCLPITKFQLLKVSHKHTPWQPLAMEIQIRKPPIQIEGSVEDRGTWVHQYMKVMEKGTNNDNVGQRSLEVEMEMKPWNKVWDYRRR